MSKYIQFTSQTFPNKEHLIAALRQLGYTRIVEGTNIALNGYGNQGQTAEIVIRKNDIGAYYGDIGFKRTDAGFVLIADDIDIGDIRGGRLMADLKGSYHEQAVRALARKHNYTIHRTVEKGKVKLRLRQ